MMRHWLLTLSMGGRVWRFSTSPEAVTITASLTGEVLTFWPGLTDPSPTAGMDSTEAGMEIPVELLLPPDAWGYLCTADDLSDVGAELALWQEDTAWESRQVWVDGRVDSPVYETEGDPISFSILESPWEDRSQIPGITEQVTGDTWPVQAGYACPEAASGQFYPYVFGCPGAIFADDTVTVLHGWPVILVEIDETTLDNWSAGTPLPARVLVAAHAMTASTLNLYNRTTGLSALVALTVVEDGLGQRVTVAEVSGTDLQITEGDELWASCQTVSEGGLAAEKGGVARGLGDVAAWLLRRSTLRLDLGRWDELTRLNPFKCDFFINTPVSAWEILNDTLLVEGIPAFWVRGQDGYALAVRPFEADLLTRTPVLDLDPERTGGDRDGGVEVSSGAENITDVVLLFGQDMALNQYQRQKVLVPVPTAGAIVHPLLASSYARSQVRRTQTLELAGYADPGTAWLMVTLWLRERTRTRRSVRYFLPADARYVPGALVRMTDAEIRWSQQLCYLTAISMPAEGEWVQVYLETVVLEDIA